MPILGADTDELERIASDFDRTAVTLLRIRGELRGRITSTRWVGPDSRSYLVEWDRSLEPLIVAVASSLSEQAQVLRTQTVQQSEASRVDPVVRGFEYVRVPGVDPLRRFITYDRAGDGRAVEVFGDLWSAHRIGIWVPGVGTTIADFDTPSLLGARRVWSGSDDVAMIEWLGYDPPDRIPTAALEMGRRAGPAAVDLNTFVAWLRDVLPDGDDRIITIGGHSYGAVVAADAARIGTPADALVLAGAPGVSAPSVDQMTLNGSAGSAASVFVAAKTFDPVRAGSLLDDVLDAGLHAMVGGLVGHPGDHTLWSLMHTDPTTPAFGATRLVTDSTVGSSLSDVLGGLRGAHRYTDDGSSALESIREVYDGTRGVRAAS